MKAVLKFDLNDAYDLESYILCNDIGKLKEFMQIMFFSLSDNIKNNEDIPEAGKHLLLQIYSDFRSDLERLNLDFLVDFDECDIHCHDCIERQENENISKLEAEGKIRKIGKKKKKEEEKV